MKLVMVVDVIYIKLGDTPRISAGIFKQNLKVKCESKNIKEIAWRYSSIKKYYI
jgi:hypothetical protein